MAAKNESKQIDEKPRIVHTDLRSITRRSRACRTIVSVQTDIGAAKWLEFGEANIVCAGRTKQYTLKAYLPEGVTDFEHDSAYALKLPLIGLQFNELLVHYHSVSLVAWVDPGDPDGFRVPRPGYDPMRMPGSRTCTTCKKRHAIVPEDHYAGPPTDPALWRAVAGKRVEILITTAEGEEPDVG